MRGFNFQNLFLKTSEIFSENFEFFFEIFKEIFISEISEKTFARAAARDLYSRTLAINGELGLPSPRLFLALFGHFWSKWSKNCAGLGQFLGSGADQLLAWADPGLGQIGAKLGL